MVKLRCKVVVVGDATVGKTSILKMLTERNFPNQYIITSQAQVYRKEFHLPSTNGAFTQSSAPPTDTPVKPMDVLSDDEYAQDEDLSSLQQQMLGHVDGFSSHRHHDHHHHHGPMDEIELYLFDMCGSPLYGDMIDDLVCCVHGSFD